MVTPNPNQPDRCPSIDPHDTLQCGRRIHEDDQCQFGGIAWKKGAPRYVSAEEWLESIRALVADLREQERRVNAQRTRENDTHVNGQATGMDLVLRVIESALAEG